MDRLIESGDMDRLIELGAFFLLGDTYLKRRGHVSGGGVSPNIGYTPPRIVLLRRIRFLLLTFRVFIIYYHNILLNPKYVL